MTEEEDKKARRVAFLREIARVGGLRGGRVRAERLSPERRKQIARMGGVARHYPEARNNYVAQAEERSDEKVLTSSSQ